MMTKYSSSINSSGLRGHINTDVSLQNNDDSKDQEISFFVDKVTSEISNKLTSFLFYRQQKEWSEKQLKFFQSLLPDCAYKEIPNQYTRDEYAQPWYYFYTNRGPLTIGWRKRVINLSWAEFPNAKFAHEIFPDEDVTKGDFYIHAHSHEKLKEYVEKIMGVHQ